MDPADEPIAVVILAGGESARLPGKLEIDAGGMPLLVRVYRNVAPSGRVYLSVAPHTSFRDEVRAALPRRVIADAYPGTGPLGGIVSVFGRIAEPLAYVVAGDAPFVDAQTLGELRAAWVPGIQAIVPVNAQGYLEPLCALYDRAAFLASAQPIRSSGSGGVAAVVESLRTRRVRISNERAFANVNTAADRRSLLQT